MQEFVIFSDCVRLRVACLWTHLSALGVVYLPQIRVYRVDFISEINQA